MADGFFPTLVSKDANANSVNNQLFVQITDGTEGLEINADGSLNAVVTATDLDIRDLTFATDKVDASGSTLGSNSGVDIGDVTVNNAGAGAAVNIQDGGNSITVDAVDLDIRNLNLTDDAVKISANTSANGAGNPIFVSFTQAPITGEVHDYDTAASVAGGATDNHDYTVVTAMLVKSVEFSTSGAGKVELQTGPIAGLVSAWVGFIPKQGGTVQVKFDPAIEVPTTGTGTVRLIRTNREGSSQDVYSTIVGIDA